MAGSGDNTAWCANLAMILLKSPSGGIYASVRLNGCNVCPLPGKGAVVKWEELKQYWGGYYVRTESGVFTLPSRYASGSEPPSNFTFILNTPLRKK